ncbi:hypothetical protein KZZ52_49030 [Dactylosporangium sp. AC04546]|uniref:hypothetical protein n=1 Tax=Dactylosporangium sp. AC04546 TaxID=2862460 RepID=UPI001EE026E5|nr:hypothetical protein [Dactylosporangium sp. AC04546]WVK81833.1 hypothetical protein KZZ52_49030 [Dactylosporangium sp. AC04546]
MNGRAPSELVYRTWLLIAEQGYLWELTQLVAGYYDVQRGIAHGPWQAADCQQILARWFDCGLIDCIALSWATRVRSDEVVHFEYDANWRTRATEEGNHLILARDDAGALLSDPSAWDTDGDGAGVMLCQSDRADGLSFDAWFDKLAGLPDHLMYKQTLSGASDGTVRQKLPEPEELRNAGSWTQAVEHAATDGLPLLCPVNRDADLVFDWEPADGETAVGESIEDIFCFVERGDVGRGQPFPFGRHRLWCPGCGAERHLVVTRKPD